MEAPVAIRDMLDTINKVLKIENCPPLFPPNQIKPTDNAAEQSPKRQVVRTEIPTSSNPYAQSFDVPEPTPMPGEGDYGGIFASQGFGDERDPKPSEEIDTSNLKEYAPIQAVALPTDQPELPSFAAGNQNLSPVQAAIDNPYNEQLPTANKPRILVAEDNIINQMVMENMLDTGLYEVTFVSDGQQAVNAHLATPHDIILMDISMPVMNGLEATTAIRQHEVTAGWNAVPIIAVTAHAMKSHQESYQSTGMNGFLPKPISKEQLDAILKQWVTTEVADRRHQLSA